MVLPTDEEIILRGYIPYPKIPTPSQSFIDKVTELTELKAIETPITVYKMRLNDILLSSKNFLENTYKLHKIPMYNPNHPFFPKKISPYELPIELDPNIANLEGYLLVQHVPIINQFYPKSIVLTANLNEITISSYIHELTHTQLDNLKGSINKYYNREVLTKFNNLLSSYMLEEDTERLLHIYDYNNINEILECAKELNDFHHNNSSLSRDELLESSMYLISDIKAHILFSQFYYGTNSKKEEIINSIQKVFDGKLSVEELLSKYEINLENSSLNKMLTYFKR